MTELRPDAMRLDRRRECPDCGLLQCVPVLPPHGEADCLRCNATLRRAWPNSLNRALALTATSLVLYLVAVFAPFLSVDIVGRLRSTTMMSLPLAFWEQGTWELAIIVLVTAILAPLAKIIVMLSVLLGVRLANPPRVLPRLFKWYRRIGPWAMVEVFLLGVFVAFTRLSAIATVEVGEALYAVAALMLTMIAADCFMDLDDVWDAMQARGLVPPVRPGPPGASPLSCTVCGRVEEARDGDRCTRCAAKLRRRLPNSLNNTWALVITATLLYLPANIYPILTLTRLGRGGPSTIIGGAQELLEAGMWPLALLVFVASIMVPVLKLGSLLVMLVSLQRRSAWRLHDRTRLYRLLDFIGRWSMIDVFMLATLVGLVRAGAIAAVAPGFGAICFGLVVVLTMVAVSCFDPREMWDAAGAQAPVARLDPDGPTPVPDRRAASPA